MRVVTRGGAVGGADVVVGGGYGGMGALSSGDSPSIVNDKTS